MEDGQLCNAEEVLEKLSTDCEPAGKKVRQKGRSVQSVGAKGRVVFILFNSSLFVFGISARMEVSLKQQMNALQCFRTKLRNCKRWVLTGVSCLLSFYLINRALQLSAIPNSLDDADNSLKEQSNAIKPFDRFLLQPSSDANRTLKNFQFWNNDTICSKFPVALLDDGNFQPGAFVSFPGRFTF